MGYFDELVFVAANEHPDCRTRVDQSWPDMCNLQFVVSGRIYLGVDGGTAGEWQGPAAFWHHPAHRFRYGPAEEGGSWHHLWVTFRGARALELLEDGFMPLTKAWALPVVPARSFETDFRALVRLVRRDGPGALPRGQLLLEQLLLGLMESSQERAGQASHEDAIRAVAARLRHEPCEAADVRELAASCHLSYSHFRRLFREYVGMAPHDYQLHCRMRWAAHQLQDARRQVQEVAAAAGYDDPAQFSKLFKRKIGMSPRQYRQSLPGFG